MLTHSWVLYGSNFIQYILRKVSLCVVIAIDLEAADTQGKNPEYNVISSSIGLLQENIIIFPSLTERFIYLLKSNSNGKCFNWGIKINSYIKLIIYVVCIRYKVTGSYIILMDT